MKVFSSMTQEKSVLPRLFFSRSGNPKIPWPDRVVPAMHATARATMVFFVTKDSTMASRAGTMEIKPMFTTSSMFRLLSGRRFRP